MMRRSAAWRRMWADRHRVGVVLVLVGIGLPLIVLPFVAKASPGMPVVWWIAAFCRQFGRGSGILSGETNCLIDRLYDPLCVTSFEIPFRWVFAFGVAGTLSGIGCIWFSRKLPVQVD